MPDQSLSNRQRWIVISVALLLALAAAIAMWRLADAPIADPTPTGTGDIGGPFALIDQDGKTVNDADFHGAHLLIFFGFTWCPDVCPLTMQKLSDALALVGSDADGIVPVMISVDPERDTPETMRSFVRAFGPRFVGLTGSQAEIDRVIKAYRVYARKVDLPDSALFYTVDHSSYLYLMGPDGAFITAISPENDAATIAGAIRNALN